MARQLTDAGVAVRLGSPAEADGRHVPEIMKLNDASGYPIEMFHGPQIQADKSFHPGRRMHGKFKTGEGGLGHLIQRETASFEKTCEFYKLLGMRGGVEYRIPIPGQPRPAELMFLHCNSCDHTIAFGLPGVKRINHLMIEVEELGSGTTFHNLGQRPTPRRDGRRLGFRQLVD